MLKNYTKSQKTVLWIVFTIFLIYAFTLVYPFIWAFINSMKGREEYAADVLGFPSSFSEFGHNYKIAYEALSVSMGNSSVPFTGVFVNSLLYTGLSTFMTVASSAVAAYTVAKYNFKLKGFFYLLAIFSMMIPLVGALPSQYRLIKTVLHFDSIPGMAIVNSGGFGYNFIMLYAFFKGISWQYAEAAFIDGASNFKVFTKVMLPQAKPALVAIFITAAIGCWNDYMTPLLFLEWKTPVLSYAVYDLKNKVGKSLSDGEKVTEPIFYAANLIATVPMIIVFSIFSNTIIENTVAGGLKG
ncbi:MAG: carbohydrate ABC transporter permease [Clostridiales bacterium]|nr:carbohydrate ABC transporter permease [Clostridiales bacterium]